MYLYENAITDDINKLFTDSDIKAVIADSVDEALRRSASEGRDVAKLPLIVLSGGDWDLEDINFYNLMHGSEFKRVSNDIPILKSTAVVPFTPSYDMYIAASSSRECDMLTREILFHYLRNPTLTVKVPYKIDETFTFNLNFSNKIRKTSRPSALVYRTLSFTLSGAYLWFNNSMNIIKEVNSEVREEFENNV